MFNISLSDLRPGDTFHGLRFNRNLRSEAIYIFQEAYEQDFVKNTLTCYRCVVLAGPQKGQTVVFGLDLGYETTISIVGKRGVEETLAFFSNK